LRRLGDVLGTDPTAIYRHFRDKDELTRAVGDEILRNVCVELPDDGQGWRCVLREMCRRLRAAYLGHPGLTTLLQTGPPMQEHELRLTEAMLRQLRRAGLAPRDVAMAYHAVIELTVGGAALDASMASVSAEQRLAAYRRWRVTYAVLDQAVFPESMSTAPYLYVGTADDRFSFALDCLLDGIGARARVADSSVAPPA
jgi:AcrR family transcriptional regulator